MPYPKGKRIQITTIEGQVVRGVSLGVNQGIWGSRRKPEDTLRIQQKGKIVAVALRNIKQKKQKISRRS